MKDGADLLLFQENCECVAAAASQKLTAVASSVQLYCILLLIFGINLRVFLSCACKTLK